MAGHWRGQQKKNQRNLRNLRPIIGTQIFMIAQIFLFAPREGCGHLRIMAGEMGKEKISVICVICVLI